VEGEALRGALVAAGGDDLLVDDDGVGHIDARVTWLLEGDAVVFVQYLGRIQLNEVTRSAFKEGRETQFGDTYFVTQLRFAAAHERYRWLNRIVAVGEGRIAPSRKIQYRIFKCEVGF